MLKASEHVYQLYDEFAHRYDLHTPPGHYRHDHALAISQARRFAPEHCRLLDLGCGTGVFVEQAIAAGIDAYGIDEAPGMVAVAHKRLGPDRVQVRRMQEIDEQNHYDVICSLSWSIHYCADESELRSVLRNCHRALRVGGALLLQVANDERMTGEVSIDYEPGPSGEKDDTLFIHQFCPIDGSNHDVRAQYVYISKTKRELLSEQHQLHCAHPSLVSAIMKECDFHEVTIMNSDSISPLILGVCSRLE